MNTVTQMEMATDVSVLDRALRILHLEDSPGDRHMVQHWLQSQNIAAEFTYADNEADFIRVLEQAPIDIILSDKSLPGYDGQDALHYVLENFSHIPFVFVTGSMGEEAAIETLKEGATDYVLKNRLSRLIPAVKRAIDEAEQEEKRRQTEEKNRLQAALLDKAQDAILVTDLQGRIQYWNKSAERIYGWPATDIIGRHATGILSSDAAKYAKADQMLRENGKWTGELAATDRTGRQLIVGSRWTLMRDEEGDPRNILIIDTDITEQKALEAKFLRSQRMDSIGALAGGIAHDLNNALAPVIMGAEILRDCNDEGDREKFLEIISTNARRATELVKQILSFARGSGGQSGPVKLSRLVTELGKMMQDTFPKSIVLSVENPDENPWTVHGDASELHQVLLNLCVNARDAMPQGGCLTLSSENVMRDTTAAAVSNTLPGPYVSITVADTGTGIPPEVLPRIFEPFFTTKQGDKGTGLGLSTVAGIVKRHGGFMDIQTQFSKGTKFKVYLPATDSAEVAEAESKKAALPLGHGELILLVDDEQTLVELTKTMLESCGYVVVTARNGLEGIARFKAQPHEIKLLITDSDMPLMDGMGTIRAIKELKPNIPVIIASGSKDVSDESQEPGNIYQKSLGKPYSLDQLLIAVNAGLRH